jgi:ATP-dependent Lhr-like helicase
VVPPVEPDPTVLALATAEQLMDRYGVLTRGSVVAEGIPGGYAGVYRVLAGAEEAGRVRRGYFVEHLGAAQFGSTGAVDRLRLAPTRRGGSVPPGGPRSTARGDGAEDEGLTTLVLAATDPASPFGASVPWPERPEETEGTHRPGRKAGAIVVTVDGELSVYLERGGRTALTYTQDAETLRSAAGRLAEQVRRGRLAGLTVGKIDGAAALADSALSAALQGAGFHTAPQGLRLRR